MTNKFLMLLLCSTLFAGCSKKEYPAAGLQPAMTLEVKSSNSSSVTLEAKRVNASHVRLLCLATADAASQSGQDVFDRGTKYTEQQIVIDGLTPKTTYTVFAVACNDLGTRSSLQIAQFTTDGDESQMYAWEASRDGVLSFTDMVLCYGGSGHRTPYRWTQDRFKPFVTYVDEQNKEHWLFDSFLCIEFQTRSHSFMVGLKLPSAGRTQWQELIDYWFERNNGVNALEAAVKDAAQRLGTPPAKRKVVMIVPDPILFAQYDDTGASTAYWGELDGRKMDFARAEDRIAVYKWYVNQVRRKFDEANYQYVELAGFYIISEELATPNDGWNYELKRTDEIIPPLAKYVHSLNEALCWIPYNRAAGYRKWDWFGIDYAYMQPNHFWDDKNERPISRFFSDIKANNLAMELEFDEALLHGKENCDVYKKRFREYMSGAIANNIYGNQPLSYYHGTNGFYELWASQAEEDKQLFHEFCQFVINNPLRK